MVARSGEALAVPQTDRCGHRISNVNRNQLRVRRQYSTRLVSCFSDVLLGRLCEGPEQDNFIKATLAVISAILFSATGHVWPGSYYGPLGWRL